VKGAFSGAAHPSKGYLDQAHHGTLFLDEIGELSLNIQVKLLRVLQQRLITRLGGVESIPVDVRILAATNRDLKQAVTCGDFRKDLYYRLNVISFVLPPMRHRKEDVPLLVEHFLKRFNEREGKHVSVIHPEVMRIFRLYDWPGNVREIENCVERAVVMADGIQVGIEHLPHNLRELNEDQDEGIGGPESGEAPNLHEMEKQQICRMLRETSWNMNTTAARLGIHRNTLRRKLERYQIRKPGRNQ
jgi:two-component system response regulator AtoC